MLPLSSLLDFFNHLQNAGPVKSTSHTSTERSEPHVQDGVTISRVETSFRVNAANGAFTVTLGDLYAEEKKDFLVKLKVCVLHVVHALANCAVSYWSKLH